MNNVARAVRGALFVLLAARASAQEALRFQLTLPDFFDSSFEGASSVIDLPERPIRRLSILLPDALQRNIASGAVQVWVNGKGITNVLDSRALDKGLMLTMEPVTLDRRRDQLFDPRENTIEIVAQDKRPRRYYQSWILRAGKGQNAYFAYSAVTSPDDPRGIPPDLLLDSPESPPVLQVNEASARVTIKGTCASSNPPVLIKLNGEPLANIARTSETFQRTVDIRRGIKELVLDAVDRKQNRRSVVIPLVTRQKEAPKPRSTGGKYALVVGTSRYGPARDAPPPLPYAAPGAAQLAKDLEEKAGFKHENIRLLLDEGAGRLELRTGFYDFAAKAEKDDLLVVYIAGRALHDPRPGRNDKMYLAPYGAQLSQIDATAVSFDDLEMWLNRSVRSNHAFFILDVGHPVEGEWRFPGVSIVNSRLLNLFSGQSGRAVLVSASAGEVSLTRSTGEVSFTYWLTKGLAGEADLNQDRVVTADELFRFVSEKVREDSQGVQNPRYRLSAGNSDAAVSELPAKARP